MDTIVEMKHITKRFPGIIANNDVSFSLRKGEIHALLGENGAGKSTLMSILFGMYQADEGEICIRGKPVHIANPYTATKLGIGMVHQHFKLVHNLTVTENIILGMEPRKSFGRIDMESAQKNIEALSTRYGLAVDPSAKIEDITVGMQQRVEILKMLYRNADILIFDEPTAVLTPQEISELMHIMRRLIEEGKSIILITHKLKEIKMAADRCTILRRGAVIGTVQVADTSEEQMAEMMVGRTVSFKVPKKPSEPTDIILKIRNLCVKNNKQLLAIKNLNLDVKRGEIFCVAGIDGNGQSELIEALTGLRKIESGTIELNGKQIESAPIRERTLTGLGHIPEDRHKYGLVLDFNMAENMILQTYFNEPLSKHGILNAEAIHRHSQELMEQFDVRSSLGALSIGRSLSGGNQQKAIIAREIHRSPQLLIAAQPTRGLDIGAIEYIHRCLVAERDKGHAILLFSLEMEEVLNLADTIAVIYEGEIAGIVGADTTNENELGLMMSGSQKGVVPDYE